MVRYFYLSDWILVILVSFASLFFMQAGSSSWSTELIVRTIHFHKSANFRLFATALALPTFALFDFKEDDQSNIDEVDHTDQSHNEPAVELLGLRIGGELNREVE